MHLTNHRSVSGITIFLLDLSRGDTPGRHSVVCSHVVNSWSNPERMLVGGLLLQAVCYNGDLLRFCSTDLLFAKSIPGDVASDSVAPRVYEQIPLCRFPRDGPEGGAKIQSLVCNSCRG